MTMEHMDVVDQAQQRDIETLREVIKNVIWGFALMVLIQLSTMTLALWETTKECPHIECPHHGKQ